MLDGEYVRPATTGQRLLLLLLVGAAVGGIVFWRGTAWGTGSCSSASTFSSTSIRLLSRATISADARFPDGSVTRMEDGF